MAKRKSQNRRNGARAVSEIEELLRKATKPLSDALSQIGKEIERVFTPILITKKQRLPRKIKKLAKSNCDKSYKMSKETLTNLSISMWGKIRQYRTH